MIPLAKSSKDPQSPFLDISSFPAEEVEVVGKQKAPSAWYEAESPFKSVYRLEEEEMVEPEGEEYVEFLADLYDEDFNEDLFEIMNEAAEFYLNQLENGFGDGIARETEVEKLLEEHFNPLTKMVDEIFDNIAVLFERSDLETMSEAEFDSLLEEFAPKATELSPDFENLFGWAKKAWNKAKKTAKNAWKKAKSAAKKAGRWALKGVWKKLKEVAREMFMEVLRKGLDRIPPKYRGLAETVAKKLGLLREIDEQEALEEAEDAIHDIAHIQRSFDLKIANLLFASDETEQDMVLAEYIAASQETQEDPIGNLHRARAEFVSQISQLEEEEDPTPYVEEFVQTILTAAKWAIRIIGEKRTKQFLARQIAKLIKRWVKNREKRRALGRVIADVGVEIVMATGQGEISSALEEELGGNAVASVVEETVRQVAELPEYVLHNEELLEGYVLAAFENAAAANLPHVLPENVYKKRPELRETCRTNGAWVMMPLQGRKYYKKYTKVFDTTICPHVAQMLTSFGGIPLATILRDQYGLSIGSGIKARVHLYEAIPGCRLFHISRYEKNVLGLGGKSAKIACSLIHPLTPFEASALTGEPFLGRNVSAKYLNHRRMINPGGRFYFLEIGAHPLMTRTPEGVMTPKRSTEVNITMNFRLDHLRLFIFLSEADSQEISMKLRQQAPVGFVLRYVMSAMEAGLKMAFSPGMYHRIKIVHPAVMPGPSQSTALKRLGPIVTEKLMERLMQWTGKKLADYFKNNAQEFIAAANDEMDGVTLAIMMNNPPGLSNIRKLLSGGSVALRGQLFPEGIPGANVKIVPGYHYE